MKNWVLSRRTCLVNATVHLLLQVDVEAGEPEMVFIDRVKVKCGLIIIDNPSMDPGHSDYLVRLKSSLKRKIFKCQSEN